MRNRIIRLAIGVSLFVAPLLTAPGRVNAATDIVLLGPPGSSQFGALVTALANGNLVVTDSSYSLGGQAAVGAVYLYDGATGDLISTLTGNVAGSDVGGGGVLALPSGNFVVLSPSWDAGTAQDVGAVTWIDGDTGLNGVVNATNSLVGSHASDRVGYAAHILTNGNVVVRSPNWANGAATHAGAVTWIDGTAGVTGPVGPSNSLVGTHPSDILGMYGPVILLDNGNYLVVASEWNNGSIVDAGAVTFGNGSVGTFGAVSESNSLVGTRANGEFITSVRAFVLADGDYVVVCPRCDIGGVAAAGAVAWGSGSTGVAGSFSTTNSLYGTTTGDLVDASVFPLSNGNYVVSSPTWDDGGTLDVGAVTWGSGTTGRVGPISASNSLIGTIYNDRVGDDAISGLGDCVWALANGNYVVCSGMWDNGAVIDAGAVTLGNGNTGGTVGVVSVSNSLVGSSMNDHVGWGNVAVLTNGNYVVASPEWDNGAFANAGAATWGNGTTGVTGTVTAANSLIGSSADDRVGYATALANGNYVVRSPQWHNGAASNAGAATWANGAVGRVGTISAVNSLVGTSTNDSVGTNVLALANGNFVVVSSSWHDGTGTGVGAVTWGNGATGLVGPINAANSLVGQNANDVGGAIRLLPNGNYVVASPNWDNGAVANVGAVTWGDGASGVAGFISAANSLIGSTANDQVGRGDDWGIPFILFPDGNFVVKSAQWDNGAVVDAGAVTWVNGSQPITGTVSAANSLVGSSTADQIGHVYEDLLYLAPDRYVLFAYDWDFGGVTNAGAVAIGSTAAGIRGPLTGLQSVHGSLAGYGGSLRAAYDSVHHQLVVGLPAENRVIVRRANLAPTASAGPDQTVGALAPVTLDGTASLDTDGDMPLTYAWTQTGGSAVTLSDPASAQPTFSAPAAPATLAFSLIVTDAWGQAAADSVVINVVPPVAPTGVTVHGPVKGVVNHDQTFDAQVSNASATAPLTYTWEVSGRTPIAHVGGLSDTLTISDTVAGTRTVTVTVTNGVGQPVSASQTIAFVVGAQTDVDAASGGTLSFAGAGQGTTEIQVPAGAVTETTTLLFETTPSATPPNGYSFAGTAFALSASRDGATLSDLTFAGPVTITLSYSDEQLGGQSEDTLRLNVRSGGTWIDAATTCAPTSMYVREMAINRVSVAICHLSDYAWFGQQQVYLPLLRK